MQLTVIPYQQKVLDYFKQHQKTWNFFSSVKQKKIYIQELQTELLKNTYKFDEAAHPEIYNKVNFAKEKLQLNLPITVYQAQFSDELNAQIIYTGVDAHIIFSGAIIKLLTEDELLAVIAHELSHIKLYTLQNGDLEITDNIITAIANSNYDDVAYYETAKLFKLYTEVFCDRGAFLVCNNINPIISSLVKIATGLEQINAESYLKQAEQIFALSEETKTEQISHPENFIRARAVSLWQKDGELAEAAIATMIEKNATLDHLDIFCQENLSSQTKEFIQLYLKPKWLRTSLNNSLAQQYFADFSYSDTLLLTKNFTTQIENYDQTIKEYFSYVLYDFANADSSLEEIPLGRAFQFAENIGLKSLFDKTIKKELQLSEKKLAQHKAKCIAAYSEIKEDNSEQIYE